MKFLTVLIASLLVVATVTGCNRQPKAGSASNALTASTTNIDWHAHFKAHNEDVWPDHKACVKGQISRAKEPKRCEEAMLFAQFVVKAPANFNMND